MTSSHGVQSEVPDRTDSCGASEASQQPEVRSEAEGLNSMECAVLGILSRVVVTVSGSGWRVPGSVMEGDVKFAA